MNNETRQIAKYDVSAINALLVKLGQLNVRGLDMIQCIADIANVMGHPIEIVEEEIVKEPEKEPEHVDGEVVE